MTFLNKQTPVVATAELEIFEEIPVQESIKETVIEEVIPQSQLNCGSIYEFYHKTAENEFLKLSDTWLRTRFRIKLSKTDGSNVLKTDWDNVSVINYPGDSMWAQIDVSIGESQTSKPLHTYVYRSYIHSLLTSTKEAQNTFLKLKGFIEDDFSEDKRHKPHRGRCELIKNSSDINLSEGPVVEWWTQLNVDLFNQMKSLLGGITLKVRLFQNRYEHFFQTDNVLIKPTIHFEDIRLFFKQRSIDGDVCLGILRGLQISPAKYPINRVEVRSHLINSGSTSKNLDYIYQGTCPRRVYACFVNNQAFSGDYTKNPLYFHHYNIRSFACYLNSQLINRTAIKPDYNIKYLSKEYLNFLQVSGQLNNHIQTTITPEQFSNGYTIFAWDLTRDNSQGFLRSGFIDPPKLNSHLHFALDFPTLTETISCIVYTEWDSLITIDSMKNCQVIED